MRAVSVAQATFMHLDGVLRERALLLLSHVDPPAVVSKLSLSRRLARPELPKPS